MTTQPQHLRALELANRYRIDRSKLRGEVHSLDNPAARGLLADVLEQRPKCVHSMDVFLILRWPVRMRATKAREMLKMAGCTDHKKVGDLTDRQAAVLAHLLRLTPKDFDTAVEDFDLDDWTRKQAA